MVSHTCFAHTAGENNASVELGVEGRLEDILMEARMVRQQQQQPSKEFAKHPAIINGVEDWHAELRTASSQMIKILDDGKVRKDDIPVPTVCFSGFEQ
jgi:Central domain of human glycogen debranching enzyme